MSSDFGLDNNSVSNLSSENDSDLSSNERFDIGTVGSVLFICALVLMLGWAVTETALWLITTFLTDAG